MTTPIMDLDEWETNQSQPNITVNEAIRWLELFASNGPILSKTETTPPESVVEDGDAYIVGSGATDEWAGHDNEIALRMSESWRFKSAPIGKLMYVVDEDVYVRQASDSSGTWEVVSVHPES